MHKFNLEDARAKTGGRRVRPGLQVLAALSVALIAACTSQSRLTQNAINCRSRDVTIVDSRFKRQGVETAWCARCKDKLYQCATNADRTTVSCVEAKEGGACF
jgi:hypothetical protein